MACNTPNVEGHFNKKYTVDELMAKNCQPPPIRYLQNSMFFLFPNIVFFVNFINVLDMYSTMHYRVCIKGDSGRVACNTKENLCEATHSSWGQQSIALGMERTVVVSWRPNHSYFSVRMVTWSASELSHHCSNLGKLRAL